MTILQMHAGKFLKIPTVTVSLLLNESSLWNTDKEFYIIPPMPPIPPIPPMPPMAGAAGVSSLISVTTASAVVRRDATPLASVKALRTTWKEKKKSNVGERVSYLRYRKKSDMNLGYHPVLLMYRNRLLDRDIETYIKFVQSRRISFYNIAKITLVGSIMPASNMLTNSPLLASYPWLMSPASITLLTMTDASSPAFLEICSMG